MAIRRANAPAARLCWHPEKLQDHNRKHGAEVALVRQSSTSSWTVADYENSSRSTINSAFYTVELKHVKDERSDHPSGYSTDSFGLLSIRDTRTNRIRTHFPIGAFGETQSRWLGELPRPFREVHAMRSIYHRVRCGLYFAKNRTLSEMVERQLNSITKKEIQCCEMLKQKELHGITPEAVNWMKLCVVCDWQDARYCVNDSSIESHVDEMVDEFMRDTEVKTHAKGELQDASTEIVRSRLVHSDQGDFLRLLNDNSWTFTDAFLRLGPAVTYLELLCEHGGSAAESKALVIKYFRDTLYRQTVRPHDFQREVIRFLTTWKKSLKQLEQTPLLDHVQSLIGQTEN